MRLRSTARAHEALQARDASATWTSARLIRPRAPPACLARCASTHLARTTACAGTGIDGIRIRIIVKVRKVVCILNTREIGFLTKKHPIIVSLLFPFGSFSYYSKNDF